MTETQDYAEEATLVPSGPILLDGLPTRAPVVLTLRSGEAALWLVDLVGQPCGAWSCRPQQEKRRKGSSACVRGAG